MRLARFVAAAAAATLAVGGFAASASFAQGNPHFLGAPEYSIADNAVTASGSIVGAGNQDAVVVLTADATVDCLNHGQHMPKGLHQSVSSAPQSFSSDSNGRINFTVTTGSVNAKCPGRMIPVVRFTSATLTATVGDVVLSDTHTF
jgi:hypothetical protein